MHIADLLRAELDQEVDATRALLQRVPEGKWDFRPHEKSMSLSRLATHVGEILGWSEVTLRRDELDFLSPEMQEWQPRELTSTSEIVTELNTVADQCRADLAATSDAEFQKPWTMRMGDQVLMEAPRYLVFRRQVLNHLVHHRGQLGVFLRMLDVPLPMIYGPTADEEGGPGG